MRVLNQILTGLLVLVLAGGCVSSRSGKVYSRNDALQTLAVEYGVVEAVNKVKIEGTRSGLGAVAGGVAGGVAGSTIGSGSDANAIGAVIGALIGLVVGAFTEEKVTGSKGLEITVRLDNGTTFAVVQAADEEFFPGDRVRILTAPDGKKRVEH